MKTLYIYKNATIYIYIYIYAAFFDLKIGSKNNTWVPTAHWIQYKYEVSIGMLSHPVTVEHEGFMVKGSPTKNLIILLVTGIPAGYPNL